MQEVSFEKAIDLILAKDPRFHREAYYFVKEALDHTQKAVKKQNRGRVRHVSGQELLEGIREYALAQYGPMAMMLLEEWGIHNSGDLAPLSLTWWTSAGWPRPTKTVRPIFREATICLKRSENLFCLRAKKAAWSLSSSNPTPTCLARRPLPRTPPPGIF